MMNIPSIENLFAELASDQRPWLILGKGPTHSFFNPAHATHFRIFALNHAMRHCSADVGHAIDLEVFGQVSCEELANVSALVVPWVPHVRQKRPLYSGEFFFGPGTKTLDQLIDGSELLTSFFNRGRLYTYNLSSAPSSLRRDDLVTVRGESFSAAVALRLLGQMGVNTVRTLGIDGGSSYGSSFGDVEAATKLRTHQTSFDTQFREMAESIRTFHMSCGPLTAQVPVEVFVGCMPEQDLAFKVLEYSIRRHASISVNVRRLHDAVANAGVEIPEPADPAARGRTPFSFQRFAIPAICEYRGRAIYVDSDMLVLKDIREMWLAEMGSHQMLSAAQAEGSGRRPQFSVMLLDCEKLQWDVNELVESLDARKYSYAQLMYEMASVPSWAPALAAGWNSLEAMDEIETRLVHFTDMDGQPWLNAWHPLGSLWCRYLLDAIADGVISEADVQQEVRLRHVRPSLLEQVRRKQADARCLPFSVLRKDVTDFFPPHRKSGSAASKWKHEAYRIRTLAKNHLADNVISPAVKRARRVASSMLGAFSR